MLPVERPYSVCAVLWRGTIVGLSFGKTPEKYSHNSKILAVQPLPYLADLAPTFFCQQREGQLGLYSGLPDKASQVANESLILFIAGPYLGRGTWSEFPGFPALLVAISQHKTLCRGRHNSPIPLAWMVNPNFLTRFPSEEGKTAELKGADHWIFGIRYGLACDRSLPLMIIRLNRV